MISAFQVDHGEVSKMSPHASYLKTVKAGGIATTRAFKQPRGALKRLKSATVNGTTKAGQPNVAGPMMGLVSRNAM